MRQKTRASSEHSGELAVAAIQHVQQTMQEQTVFDVAGNPTVDLVDVLATKIDTSTTNGAAPMLRPTIQPTRSRR